jgi:hypothetical protein
MIFRSALFVGELVRTAFYADAISVAEWGYELFFAAPAVRTRRRHKTILSMQVKVMRSDETFKPVNLKTFLLLLTAH